MAVNHKLTNVVKDRVVQNFRLNASELLISFVDGSTMTVTIAECNSPPLHQGVRMRQISETIVDPGNFVILRDKNSHVEYLG